MVKPTTDQSPKRHNGPVITVGPDVSSAGFGGAALPAGASTAPPPVAMTMLFNSHKL